MAGVSPEGFTMFSGYWYRNFAARVIEVEYPLSSIKQAHKDEWPSLRDRQGELQLGAVEFAALKFISERTRKHRAATNTYLSHIFIEGSHEGAQEDLTPGPSGPDKFGSHYGVCLCYINQDGTVLVRQIVNHLDRISENFEEIQGTDPEDVRGSKYRTDDLIEDFESLHRDGFKYTTPPEVVDIRPDYCYLRLDHEDTVEGAEDITRYFKT